MTPGIVATKTADTREHYMGCCDLQDKVEDKYEEVIAELHNERNWLSYAEQQLLDEHSISEDEDNLHQQLKEHKVSTYL